MFILLLLLFHRLSSSNLISFSFRFLFVVLSVDWFCTCSSLLVWCAKISWAVFGHAYGIVRCFPLSYTLVLLWCCALYYAFTPHLLSVSTAFVGSTLTVPTHSVVVFLSHHIRWSSPPRTIHRPSASSFLPSFSPLHSPWLVSHSVVYHGVVCLFNFLRNKNRLVFGFGKIVRLAISQPCTTSFCVWYKYFLLSQTQSIDQIPPMVVSLSTHKLCWYLIFVGYCGCDHFVTHTRW